MAPERLRVIDFGLVSGLRSQTLWHALAHGVSRGAPPTLSFMEPSEPYVSIGFHRSTNELDPDVCGPGGLPVYRRMVGGGPVYIDRGQHFFQIIVPHAMAPAKRGDAVRELLEPAVQAFGDVGIDAVLDDHNEVVLGDQKICGHAAGQIEDAVVVVGNLINSFDHKVAASIAKAPSQRARDEFTTQMERFVAATPADPRLFKAAAADRYSTRLGLTPEKGDLLPAEQSRIAELDREFVDPEWVNAIAPHSNGSWRAKVKSAVWVGFGAANGYAMTASLHGDRVLTFSVDARSGGEPPLILPAVEGMTIDEAAERLGSESSDLADLFVEMTSRPPV